MRAQLVMDIESPVNPHPGLRGTSNLITLAALKTDARKVPLMCNRQTGQLAKGQAEVEACQVRPVLS